MCKSEVPRFGPGILGFELNHSMKRNNDEKRRNRAVQSFAALAYVRRVDSLSRRIKGERNIRPNRRRNLGHRSNKKFYQ